MFTIRTRNFRIIFAVLLSALIVAPTFDARGQSLRPHMTQLSYLGAPESHRGTPMRIHWKNAPESILGLLDYPSPERSTSSTGG